MAPRLTSVDISRLGLFKITLSSDITDRAGTILSSFKQYILFGNGWFTLKLMTIENTANFKGHGVGRAIIKADQDFILSSEMPGKIRLTASSNKNKIGGAYWPRYYFNFYDSLVLYNVKQDIMQYMLKDYKDRTVVPDVFKQMSQMKYPFELLSLDDGKTYDALGENSPNARFKLGEYILGSGKVKDFELEWNELYAQPSHPIYTGCSKLCGKDAFSYEQDIEAVIANKYAGLMR